MPAMRTRKTLLTAEELFGLPAGYHRYELVEGVLREMPLSGAKHGDIALRVGSLLAACPRIIHLGKIFAAGTGFVLRSDPDTVRAPDASFVAAEMVPEGELPAGYLELSPDLAVEVLSPEDRPREVVDKVHDWLAAGSRLVWVLNPVTRSAAVYRSLEDRQELSEDNTLDGDQVISGFTCSVRDLFS